MQKCVSLQSFGGKSSVGLLTVRQLDIVVKSLSHLLVFELLQSSGLFFTSSLSFYKILLQFISS